MIDNAAKLRWREFLGARSTPFQDPDWIAYQAQADTAWILDLDCGFAPLYLVNRNSTRTLRLFGGDYEDLVAKPDQENEVLQRFLSVLKMRRAEFDICDFRCLLPDSVVLSLFSDGQGNLNIPASFSQPLRGFTVRLVPHHSYYVVNVPENWEQMEAHLGKKLAYKIRAEEGRRRKYFTTHSLRQATLDTLDEDFATVVSAHTIRWQARGQRGQLWDPAVCDRLKTVCRSFLSRGQLRIYALQLDGQPASGLLCLSDAKRVYFLMGGFDPKFAKHHPGKVLIAQAIKDCVNDGPPIFDFIKGEEAYKDDWANGRQQLYRLVIAKNTLRGLSALWVLQFQGWYKDRRRARTLRKRSTPTKKSED